MDSVVTLAAWVSLGFLALIGATIVFLIWSGKIDLTRVISEPTGDASMSRLQLLIFTFVVAASLVIAVAAKHSLPDIPQGVLILVGISGSSYLVSKGIQFSSDAGVEDRPPVVTISPDKVTAHIGAGPIQLSASVLRTSNQEVVWTIDAPAYGTIDRVKGLYTPPAQAPASPVVTVRATSVVDSAASGTAAITLTS